MRAGESELQMCVRHVAEQEDRIARQDVLVERLRERRSPKLDDSLQLLGQWVAQFERVLPQKGDEAHQGQVFASH